LPSHTKSYERMVYELMDDEKQDMIASPLSKEITEFVEQKRAEGWKYIYGECVLRAFDKFCSMKENENYSLQQLADVWCKRAKEKNAKIGMIRGLGNHLTMRGSTKSFVVPYANGGLPKPAFNGYASLFAEGIISFLNMARSVGLEYKYEEYFLKEFDRFCIGQHNVSPQQMADAFIVKTEEVYSNATNRRIIYVIKALGSYLTENDFSNAYTIIDKDFIAGPFAEEISVFVAFKKSCGFKYYHNNYILRLFDSFCVLEGSESLQPQQLADKWVLKRENEHPNTRNSRVSCVRSFSKYLTSIGHPKAFVIENNIAQKGTSKPPFLFTEDDINTFFAACSELKPNEKEPSASIVLPTAFLFMYCMGVRTCELKIPMENVNLETGEVIIVDAKGGDRVLYMSEELSEFLNRYNLLVEEFFPHHKYLFPASVNRSRNDFAKHFRNIWALCDSDIGCEGPRLYDFRHHFLYRNVELCMRTGEDVNVLQPYLMKHMGHKKQKSFQYYFHLSPPIRNEVSQIKNNLDWMMPDVPEVPYE